MWGLLDCRRPVRPFVRIDGFFMHVFLSSLLLPIAPDAPSERSPSPHRTSKTKRPGTGNSSSSSSRPLPTTPANGLSSNSAATSPATYLMPEPEPYYDNSTTPRQSQQFVPESYSPGGADLLKQATSRGGRGLPSAPGHHQHESYSSTSSSYRPSNSHSQSTSLRSESPPSGRPSHGPSHTPPRGSSPAMGMGETPGYFSGRASYSRSGSPLPPTLHHQSSAHQLNGRYRDMAQTPTSEYPSSRAYCILSVNDFIN